MKAYVHASRLTAVLIALIVGFLGINWSHTARAQGVLTNGAEIVATLAANTTNAFTFNATNGDTILLRCGMTNLDPRILLFNPSGQLFATAANGAAGVHDAGISVQATNTGLFKVEVSSIFGGSGTYNLNLARIPGDFVVSPGDDGGPLTNGWEQTATNDMGDLDMWTFTVNAGDSIVLRMGSTNFNPWIRLYGPTGVLVGSAGNGAAGALNIELALQATNSGTFTVVASSFSGNGAGSYLLNLAKSPGTIFVAPGDEGGPLINGWKHMGRIDLGDLDMWSFSANSGESIVLRMGATNYNPWIRLYGPTGALVGSAGNGGAGALNAEFAVSATNSGSFTVVASSFGGNGVGSYLLNLAKSPGTIFVAPGDEGGPLTNGWKHMGRIELGDLDVWSFSANSGESIVLRMGATNYNPWIRLYGPTGALVGSAGSGIAGALNAELAISATNSGSFTIVASSFSGNGAGSYLLNLAKSPGTIFVAPGDDGGPLTNGWKHTGTIELADLDVWTFDANAGDTLVFRMAASTYNPWIRLYGPDGKLAGTAGTGIAGNLDVNSSIQASNSGAFTLVASSFSGNGVGNYLLNLARLPGAFFVAPGDEGGALVGGISQDGVIETGDMDLWRFAACRAELITLNCQKLSGTSFSPRIRLYGRSGMLLAMATSTTLASINFLPPNTGLYTVVVDGGNVGDSGAYHLTGNGLSAELNLCVPLISGTTLNLDIVGGVSAADFILYTATNLATPAALWSPILTNHFDQFGVFAYTNSFNQAEPERYFRLSEP